MSDDKAVDEFLSYLNLQKRFSPLTTKHYAVDLKQFFNFLNQEVYCSGDNDSTCEQRSHNVLFKTVQRTYCI